jgi:hypothetical protein
MNTTSNQCAEWVHGRISKGIMSKGTESFKSDTVGHQCPRHAVEGGRFCAQHQAIRNRMAATIARRARTLIELAEAGEL